MELYPTQEGPESKEAKTRRLNRECQRRFIEKKRHQMTLESSIPFQVTVSAATTAGTTSSTATPGSGILLAGTVTVTSETHDEESHVAARLTRRKMQLKMAFERYKAKKKTGVSSS